MPNDNVVDFPSFRLSKLRTSLAIQSKDSSHFELPDIPQATLFRQTGTTDSALVAGLVIRLTRTNGRCYDRLPTLVRTALDDLCADGDATCRLVRCWLLDESLADQPPVSTSAPVGQMDRIFRHNRFWRPGSPWLEKADNRRREKLTALLAELEGGK